MNNLKNKIVITVCAALSFVPAAFAGEFEAGVAAYKKNDFKGALTHFNAAIGRNQYDSNSIYYRAVILAHMGRVEDAKRDYASLIKNFPNTPASQNAIAAMGYMDPTYLRQLTGGAPRTMSGSVSTSATTSGAPGGRTYGELVGAPTESKVYFENMGANLLIDATVNNRPCKMLFDSGAGSVTFGLEKAKELGIRIPEGGPTERHSGMGGNGTVGAWQSTVTLKVGQIEKRNFPVSILENSEMTPLLGQTFYREFNISIDNAAKSIRFAKKTQAGPQPYGSGVASGGIPFRREGNHVIVKVEFNGRPIDCYLDTGAETIALSEKHARALGLVIPDDAQEGISQGVGGQQVDKIFTVARISCGPIVKSDLPIHVGKIDIPHPLLGQAFFGSLRYEVDDVNQVINMRY